MANRMLIALLVLIAPLSWARAQEPVLEDYSIGAQYRGELKKGYSSLGKGKASYEALGNGSFRVRVKAEVKHPDEDKTYAFRVHQTFRLDGDQIVLVDDAVNEMNASTRPHEKRITEIIPFAYLARSLKVPEGQGENATRTFHYRGEDYLLRYMHADRQMEVSLYSSDTILAKFFLDTDSPGDFARLEKLRIAIPAEKLVLSFVVVPPGGDRASIPAERPLEGTGTVRMGIPPPDQAFPPGTVRR